jgi:polyisoprenoid-binding protein YceI
MKVRHLLIAASLAVPFAAQAAPVTYTLDADHSFPTFSYNHLGYSNQTSRFDKTTGKIVYDAEAEKGSVDIVIDMKSVSTGSPTFNEHIQGEDYFDTAKYPTATFKSTAVKFVAGKPASIDGKLTIKGVTQPVTLKITHFKEMMHPMLKREAIGANAVVVVKRSSFNAGKYAPFVGDDVTINIAIEALKAE